MIVGNHDTVYKNTNELNSVNLLLKEYDNVIEYEAPEDSVSPPESPAAEAPEEIATLPELLTPSPEVRVTSPPV